MPQIFLFSNGKFAILATVHGRSPEIGTAGTEEVYPVLEGESLLQSQLEVEPARIRIEPVSRGDVCQSAPCLLPSYPAHGHRYKGILVARYHAVLHIY